MKEFNTKFMKNNKKYQVNDFSKAFFQQFKILININGLCLNKNFKNKKKINKYLKNQKKKKFKFQ